MGTRLFLIASLALAACAENDGSEEPETIEEAGRGGARGDTDGERDLGEPTEDPNSDDRTPPTGTEDPANPGTEPDPTEETPERPTDPGDASCDSSTIDGAIDCQVIANDMFVDAFCDCYTEAGYEGDRGACESEQPGAEAFQPDACTLSAMRSFEAAAVANSMCYADAVLDLAGCFSVCPADEDSFNACFDAVGAAFDTCDARVPQGLRTAIEGCSGDVAPPAETPGELEGAIASLRAQRDSYVAQYCECYVGPEFADSRTCRSTVENQWDPGLSSCEQAVFASNPAASGEFVSCITETFLIAESACLECPSPGMFEYEMCADLSIDLNFCFSMAPQEIQDGLLACPR